MVEQRKLMVAWLANCCNCGRVVDTREEADGGDKFGAEASDGRWLCSIECWDAVFRDNGPYASSPASGVMVKETGWLIELRGLSPQWWSMTGGEGGYFTIDSLKALRFARKQDAEAFIDETGWTEAFASEHEWADLPPALVEQP